MTKKLFFSLAASALLLGSCASDEPVAVPNGGNVTFTTSLPADIMSRSAYDDGLTATNLEYAVYDESGANIAGLNGTGTFVNRETTVSLNLVTGKTYTIVFWASADGAPYSFDAATGQMTVTTTGDAQDKTRDAFYAAETFVVTGAISKTVELKRPFAQINIGTSDLADFTAAGGSISKSGITVTAPDVLNLLDGTVSGEAEYVLAPAAHVEADIAFPVATTPAQRFLATNYVLVDRQKSTLDITWTSDNDTPGRSEVVYTYIPVQRNYRTNIYGALLTNPAHYEVKIIETFEDGDLNENQDEEMPEIAPGVFYNEAAKTYKVMSAEGFQWFAENKTLGSKETLTLGANIDFEGKPAGSIATSWQSNAVVDGKGFTIKNVVFDSNNVCLFHGGIGGSSASKDGWVGTIKNLNIDGITGEVSTRFCGVVGNLYGNMENVHVKNVTIKSTEGRVGALIGIHNSGAMKNCSVENADITGGWSVGGMIGGINENKTKRVYQNLTARNIKVTNTHAYGGVYDLMVGVIMGDLNIGGVSFIDCVIEDCDTTLPIYKHFNDYTWDGVLKAADIDESGNDI